MQQQDVETNLVTYNAVISACAASKTPEQALEVVKAVQQNGVEPNLITYNAVLSAAEASGKQPLPQKAPPQYERRSPPRGVFPGLTFFSQALEAQAGSSRVA